MPEYYAEIKNDKLCFTRLDLLVKWLTKNSGLWVKVNCKLIGKSKDPKTKAQLGYYWALLVPEICEELIRQGYTNTIHFKGIEREIPYTQEATHELLTELCGYVGENGKHLRLSECDLIHALKFIDNVLDFAIGTLGMNGEALKARRPNG